MVRVHCGPYKKDDNICYHPFYYAVVGGEPHFEVRNERAKCGALSLINWLSAGHKGSSEVTSKASEVICPLRFLIKESFLISAVFWILKHCILLTFLNYLQKTNYITLILCTKSKLYKRTEFLHQKHLKEFVE